MATGFGYARDKVVAVMNNTWGAQGRYYNQMRSAILEDAIKYAINSGRRGKGIVVVSWGHYNIIRR